MFYHRGMFDISSFETELERTMRCCENCYHGTEVFDNVSCHECRQFSNWIDKEIKRCENCAHKIFDKKTSRYYTFCDKCKNHSNWKEKETMATMATMETTEESELKTIYHLQAIKDKYEKICKEEKNGVKIDLGNITGEIYNNLSFGCTYMEFTVDPKRREVITRELEKIGYKVSRCENAIPDSSGYISFDDDKILVYGWEKLTEAQIESEVMTLLKVGIVKKNIILMREAIDLYSDLTESNMEESKKYVEYIISKYKIQPS